MTKEELEKLRNDNRHNLVEVFHKTAQLYEKFAEIIKNGGILTDNDFNELNEIEFVTIPFKDNNISLSYLFTDIIEGDVKENGVKTMIDLIVPVIVVIIFLVLLFLSSK